MNKFFQEHFNFVPERIAYRQRFQSQQILTSMIDSLKLTRVNLYQEGCVTVDESELEIGMGKLVVCIPFTKWHTEGEILVFTYD